MHLRLIVLLLAALAPLAAQAPYSTLIPFPKSASCGLKIVGTLDGANAASIKTYSESGVLLATTAVDVSTRKTVTHSIPSTTDVASVVVESVNGTAALAHCQELIGWWPGPFFAFRPILSNFTLQGDDFRNKGFPLTVAQGIRSTPVLQYSDAPSAATVDIKTGPYAVQQILSRNGTARNSMDALLGTSVMVNAQTATARIAQPDTGSLTGYERIYTGLTSYTLPHGEADYEHVLPNHYSNVGAPWINLVSVLANKPTVVYFTAKASDGRTLDVQRRVLKQDERFIAYPESIFATTKDLAWILIRADQRVETTSFYIQGTQIKSVNGLTRTECGKRLVSGGAQGESSVEAVVSFTPEIIGGGFIGDRKPSANVSIAAYDSEGRVLGTRTITIPFEGQSLTSGGLAAFFGVGETVGSRISSVVYQASERICSTGTNSLGAYKSLPTDSVIATAGIRDRFNPRTGEFVVKHGEGPAVIELSAVVNSPNGQITGISFDANYDQNALDVFNATAMGGTLRRLIGERASAGGVTRLELPVNSFSGTIVYAPQLTTTVRLQSGAEEKLASYPLWLRVNAQKTYGVNELLGPNAAKTIIRADIPGFAKLMTDPGFVAPPGTYANLVTGLASLTDGNPANGELVDIILLDTLTPKRIVFRQFSYDGATVDTSTVVATAYDLSNDLSEQKMREFILFFGVEPTLKY